MKYIIVGVALVCSYTMVSCKKNATDIPPKEESIDMQYINLNNVEIKYQTRNILIDINKDGGNDLLFEVAKMRDTANKQDRFKFNIITSFATFVPANRHEQIPVFRKDYTISLNDFGVYNWKGAVEITLMEKVIFEDGSVTWFGNWMAANRHYLPLQLRNRNQQRFNGWVEITADAPGGRLILHRAAFCKEANKEIKAGN